MTAIPKQLFAARDAGQTAELSPLRRAERVCASIQERAWKVAEAAGIPRHGCCLHNASIDDGLTGWCAGNPERLKAAKRATAMLNGAWALNDLGSRIWRRAYNRTVKEDWAKYDVNHGREINVALLFARP